MDRTVPAGSDYPGTLAGGNVVGWKDCSGSLLELNFNQRSRKIDSHFNKLNAFIAGIKGNGVILLEKTFTFRFYDVSRENEGIPSMLEMLESIASIANKTDREKVISQDYTIRLENLEPDGANAVVGELVRCQGTNFPAELDGNSRKALTVKRLGHSVVFRLNHKTGVFGIQHDARVVGPTRILTYIASFNAAAIYSMTPKINEDAWKKFTKGATKRSLLELLIRAISIL